MSVWSTETNPFGPNRSPALFAKSEADDGTFVALAADPATGRLLVNSTGGGSGGTSSTFGSAFPTTGTAVGASDGTDMQPLLVDGSGNLKVDVEISALPTGAATSADQTNGSQLTQIFDNTSFVATNVNAVTNKNGLYVASNSATGSGVPANAFYAGYEASTALPTATTATDLVGGMADKFGRQIAIPQAPRDLVGFQEATFTASTASAAVVTGVSNIFSDISSISLANSGASATLFTLSDGTNSYYFYVPAGDMRGAVYQVPLAATTVATNWTGQCGTSTSSVYCTIQYIKNR